MTMVEKSKRVTIEISTDTYDKLCGVKAELEKIFHEKVGFDKVIQVILSPKLVDYSEMLLK